MAGITLENLSKTYPGSAVPAVVDLNLDINDQEFFALLGQSGCGKSTTMRMIAGLEQPTSGEVYIGGKNVTDLSPADRDIAMVFENYALYPHLNSYENIAFPLRIRKMPKKVIHEKVMHVAEMLHVTGFLYQNVKTLSGGQQQRIGVARALVRTPSVFILDEPISHLEASLRARMRNELKQTQISLGVTTVYVTHDQIEAMSMADRIAVMENGELLQVATPHEIYKRPINKFVASFIGEPPMNFLEGELFVKDDNLFVNGEAFQVELSSQVRHSLIQKYHNTSIQLGVRPFDIEIFREKPEGTAFKANVIFCEPRNEQSILDVEVGEKQLLVGTKVIFESNSQGAIWLKPKVEKIHLFNANGENILYQL
jgi:multiple sugar transport system ATP-binding protein